MLITRLTRIFSPQILNRCYSRPIHPIVATKDGSTIVCWHPEKPYPYEFTKPLPRSEIVETTSVLRNSDHLKNIRQEKEEFVVEELAKMTYTTKHRWFPPKSKKKRGKTLTKDREYL